MDKNFLIWPTPNSGVIKKEKKIEGVLMSRTLYEIKSLTLLKISWHSLKNLRAAGISLHFQQEYMQEGCSETIR
jgi:hypothetical protein